MGSNLYHPFTNVHGQPHWGPGSADDSDKSFQCACYNASQAMNTVSPFSKYNIQTYYLWITLYSHGIGIFKMCLLILNENPIFLLYPPFLFPWAFPSYPCSRMCVLRFIESEHLHLLLRYINQGCPIAQPCEENQFIQVWCLTSS